MMLMMVMMILDKTASKPQVDTLVGEDSPNPMFDLKAELGPRDSEW